MPWKRSRRKTGREVSGKHLERGPPIAEWMSGKKPIMSLQIIFLHGKHGRRFLPEIGSATPGSESVAVMAELCAERPVEADSSGQKQDNAHHCTSKQRPPAVSGRAYLEP